MQLLLDGQRRELCESAAENTNLRQEGNANSNKKDKFISLSDKNFPSQNCKRYPPALA
jgi:hypothetical protein